MPQVKLSIKSTATATRVPFGVRAGVFSLVEEISGLLERACRSKPPSLLPLGKLRCRLGTRKLRAILKQV